MRGQGRGLGKRENEGGMRGQGEVWGGTRGV